jgi:xylulokinase
VDKNTSYEEMNELASESPVGSNGLRFYPYGNGVERLFENKDVGASVEGFEFNVHTKNDLLRAAQEGIVFSLVYGIEIMQKTGIEANVIKAGKANMFLSPIFRETLAGSTGATIELYDTDGAEGAARGAGVGAGIFNTFNEAFQSLEKLEVIKIPDSQQTAYKMAYQTWKKNLEEKIKNL